MVTFVATQGYSNSYPTEWVIKPTQPIAGDASGNTLASEFTIAGYDIITPYATNNVVANPAQTTRRMVATGLTVLATIFCDVDLTVRLYADLFSGTFRLAQVANFTGGTGRAETITFDRVGAFFLQVRVIRVAGAPGTFEYHTRCLDI